MDTKKLRQKILDLAIHGKLVPQDPNDEPASVLLERIRKEKEQLIKEGKIKSPKKSKSAGDTSHYPKEVPWELPKGWVWLSGEDIFLPMESTSPKGEFFEYIDIDAIDNATNCIKKPKHLAVVNAPSRATRKVSKGDVLFSMVRPYLRNIAMVELDSCIASTGFYVCRCSEILDSKYCYYLMLSNYVVEGLNQFMKGDNSPSINNTHITSWIYPIPPLSEQKRISGAIDGLLTYVGNLEGAMSGIVKCIDEVKSKLLDLAIHGKLVPQYPSDEPAIELLKRINPAFKPSDNLHYGGSLPTGWVCATYGALNQHRNRSINPMDSPKEQYELYSVPIYDTGYPEYLTGKEIGSTKQAVEKGDVLLCKINPHLNRAWVVEHYNPMLKCIASSEWLIFQSDALCPDYTRLFFMSPEFRSLMLSNVSGVGGSLMRARASAVDGYPIWVPPIDEQKRIVKVVKAYYKVLDEIVAGPS